ncbi:hypothetical protein [Actinoplanes sp. G11-F43]
MSAALRAEAAASMTEVSQLSNSAREDSTRGSSRIAATKITAGAVAL